MQEEQVMIQRIPAAFLAVALMLVPAAGKQIAKKGIVNFLAGSVTIEYRGTKTAAKVGDELREGMAVVTGANSQVDLYFGEERVIKVLENSRFEITELMVTEKKDSSSFFLKAGKIFTRIKDKLDKDEEFKVRTNTATAAVRGTEFYIEEDEESVVACTKGSVNVENEDSRVVLKEGQEVPLAGQGRLAIQRLKKDRLQHIMNIKDQVRDLRKDFREQFINQRMDIRNLKDQKEKFREDLEKNRDKFKRPFKGNMF